MVANAVVAGVQRTAAAPGPADRGRTRTRVQWVIDPTTASLVVLLARTGTLAGVVKARDAYIARGLELGGLPAAVVAQMGEAKVVDLSHNRIEELPASICTLASMESFLAHDNLLRELPRAFPQLWSLVNLDLSCNRLTELPDNFPTLPCLRVLRLGQNELSELPENIGNMTTLTSLSGSHNLLKALPHSFTQVRSGSRGGAGRALRNKVVGQGVDEDGLQRTSHRRS